MNYRKILIASRIFMGLLFTARCSTPLHNEPQPESLQGSEIVLNQTYWKAISDEPELNETDILKTVNRFYDIMELSRPEPLQAYLLAVLMDSVIMEISTEIRILLQDLATTTERVAKISEYTANHVSHTQIEPQFQNYPWKDPWGIEIASGHPTYKKLLPAEMKAMSCYTGKISGKCMTLAHLLAGIFYWLGVAPEDMLTFITQNPGYRHANAMLVFEDSLIFTNNQYLTIFDPPGGCISAPISVIGFYNPEMTVNWEHVVQSDIDKYCFLSNQSAVETFLQKFKINENCVSHEYQLPNYHSRRELSDVVFLNPQHLDIFYLARYASQSLYVKHPEMYLKASLGSSLAKETAEFLATPEQVFGWIAANIATKSIFAEWQDHIMTADQVLVFRQGGVKDQAVLAYTLLKHQGLSPRLYLTLDNAFLEFGEQLISVRHWETVDVIQERILLGPLAI